MNILLFNLIIGKVYLQKSMFVCLSERKNVEFKNVLFHKVKSVAYM